MNFSTISSMFGINPKNFSKFYLRLLNKNLIELFIYNKFIFSILPWHNHVDIIQCQEIIYDLLYIFHYNHLF